MTGRKVRAVVETEEMFDGSILVVMVVVSYYYSAIICTLRVEVAASILGGCVLRQTFDVVAL